MRSFIKIVSIFIIFSYQNCFCQDETISLVDNNNLLKIRSLFINGDLEEAKANAELFLIKYPTSDDVQHLLFAINDRLKKKQNCRLDKRSEMLHDVDNSWRVSSENGTCIDGVYDYSDDFLQNKLSKIIIPNVCFSNAPLSNVVCALSELSMQYDLTTDDESKHGVNVVVINNQSTHDPIVNINVRNLSLDRILRFVAQSVGYKYDIDEEVVVFSPRDYTIDNLKTKFFPVSRATVVRLLGEHTHMSGQNITSAYEEVAIKKFLQRAGVNFENINGSSLAFDGSQLIVTHTPQKLKLLSNILKKYATMKQVEIEIKFLEVQQGVLDELAFRWGLQSQHGHAKLMTGETQNGVQVDNLRTLSQTFGSAGFTGGDGMIVGKGVGSSGSLAINNYAPTMPGAINIGTKNLPFADMFGVMHGNTVSLMIRALEQQTGSDLMSSPKITVLSGKTAKIVVAQELRYPESYGETHSEVGNGSSLNSSTSAGVTITAGTPRDFVTRNVGVEMTVTPIVEEDGCISLQLAPKVTEFEGFVEYGGQSVAVSAGCTVTVPSGFYQPVFSTREIKTEVTVRDGSTVIMGGLTREEVKEVNDKVPLLGDLPLLGRLFRSKGKTSQKKNLLIFVKAKVLSPNGHDSAENKSSVDSILIK